MLEIKYVELEFYVQKLSGANPLFSAPKLCLTFISCLQFNLFKLNKLSKM